MDKTKVLKRNEAISLVKDYKRVIASRYRAVPRVVMYGSYAKGGATADSDIDVAVIVPADEIVNPWEQWADLYGDVRKVSSLIEPILLENDEDSPIYREVMRTGIAV